MVVTPDVLESLARHRWPGNIRELANVIEHALVLCDELPLSVEHLPARLGAAISKHHPESKIASPQAAAFAGALPAPPAVPAQSRKPESLRDLEMRAIVEGLERNHGNKARTAEELGISLKTLYNKLHQLQEAAPVV
jgi:two-component system NtrC family response regulator